MSQFIRQVLLLIYCFGYIDTYAEHVVGKVLDAETKQALIGATIWETQSKTGTTTNQQGEFNLTIELDSSSKIEISYLGYTSQTIPYSQMNLEAKSPQENIILLHESTSMINPVVVTGSKRRQQQLHTPTSIQTIQPYLFQNTIRASVEDAMQQIPGVNTADGQINIRSGSGWSYGTGSRVSVLVDGLPVMNAGTGQIMWSLIPFENISQMEILKGASSVLYGSSALNGVVNIRTQLPEESKGGELLSASVFSGVYDKPRRIQQWSDRPLLRNGGHVLYGKHIKAYRFNYVVSAFINLDDSYRMGDQDKRGRLSFRTQYQTKNKNWTFGLNGNAMQGRTGSFLLWENHELAHTSYDSSFALNSASRLSLDPSIAYTTGTWEHSFKGRYLRVENNIDALPTEPDQKNTTQLFYGEFQSNPLRPGKAFQYHVGSVMQYGVSNASMFLGQRNNANIAVYFQLDYSQGRWDINLGGRYEYYRLDSYEEGKPVFKVGANYRMAKASFVRASFGQGYRFPVVSEAFIQTSAGPVNIFPNPDLRSEFGYNAELGFRQVIPIGAFNLLADVALYRMYFNRMMEFSFNVWDGSFGFKALNIGQSQVSGVELALTGKGKIRKTEWTVLAGYNYADPVNLNPEYVYGTSSGVELNYQFTSSDSIGRVLKYRQRHLVKADIQCEWHRFLFGVAYRYQSQMENIDRAFVDFPLAIFAPGVAETRIANEAGDHILDARIAYRISSRLKITFVVDNIFNEEYYARPMDAAAPRTFSTQISFNY